MFGEASVTGSSSQVSPAAIHRSLKLSVLDGMLHAVMVGLSETYIGAFAVELGHRDAALAVLMTVPLLVGALGQLFTATLVAWLGSRKRVVVVSALIQAASHVLLWQLARRGDTAFAPLMIAATMFWGSGLVLGPAWNSWMAALTREVGRARYFAMRSAALNVALLLSFSAAGYALSRARDGGVVLATFAWMFAIAMVVRLLSVMTLAAKIDPDPIPARGESTWQRTRVALSQGRFRVAVFAAVMMFGAHVSVPFYTPYMLRTLRLDMLAYAWLIAAAIASKALCFGLWRRAAERFGMPSVLLGASVVVAALPVQWVWFTSVPSLLIVQLVSGAAWGGFEYASLQLLLRDAPQGQEVEFFSVANSGSGVLQVIGALLGSALLSLPDASYHTAFVASSLLRGVSLLLLLSVSRQALRAPSV
jgi:MFS family permease